jgi:hypothetical protein
VGLLQLLGQKPSFDLLIDGGAAVMQDLYQIAIIKATGSCKVITPADKSIPLGRWNGGIPAANHRFQHALSDTRQGAGGTNGHTKEKENFLPSVSA